MVFIPILPKVAVSFKPLIPDIMLNKTSGIAISFNNRIKISPTGAIHFIVKSLQPIYELRRAHRIPKISPMIILAARVGFFILNDLG